MTLVQSGASVTGTYGSDRRLEGTVYDGLLSGRWAGPPTYAEPSNAGRFVFTVSQDCNFFTGTWGFGSASTGGGGWFGVRVTTSTPSPSGLCSWTGAWDTTSNQQRFAMTLVQSGAFVTGTYGSDRRLEGVLSGRQFSGRWAGPPTYTEPYNAGRFAFTISSDCSFFTGTWGFGSANIGGGAWFGVRATAAPGPCSWTGVWDTRSNNEQFAMTLVQSGASVIGTYGSDRRLEGTASGGQLSGRWAGPPTYTEPNNAGRFVFTVSSDCGFFTGTWGFSSANTGGGVWTGTRLPSPPQRSPLIADLYRTVLCREPDPAGLSSWAGSGLAIEEIRLIFEGSPEGRRVSAVRSIYLSLVDRDPLGPDCAGLRAWADSLLTLDEIHSSLLTSAERTARVREIYLQVLARDPLWNDVAGLRAWAESGLSLAEVRVSLLLSGEGQRVAAVRQLYIALLGRDPLGPDNAGLRGWVDSGLSLEEIKLALMQSDEYRRRTGGR